MDGLTIRAWNDKIKALPPIPRALLMNHAVPYGRLFRQWDTNGDLWIWINPGQIYDLPRSTLPTYSTAWPLSGIPVISR